jgi:hypothetical protein
MKMRISIKSAAVRASLAVVRLANANCMLVGAVKENKTQYVVNYLHNYFG